MFFKKMTEKESINWRSGAIFGFYTYLLVLVINQIYYLTFESHLFSLTIVFWTGLIAAFGCEIILNIKDKIKSNKV